MKEVKKNEVKLTLKQKKFCEYYVASGNATQSAIKAGYSQKTAEMISSENLRKPYIIEYIKDLTKPSEDKRIADMQEIRQFWTNVVRNEEEDMKDRLKASEYIAKTNGAFIDKVDVNANVKKINPLDGLTTEELKRLVNGSD